MPDPFDIESLLDDPDEDASPSRKPLVLWLVTLSVAILFAPLYLLSTTLQADVNKLETELVSLGGSLPSTAAEAGGDDQAGAQPTANAGASADAAATEEVSPITEAMGVINELSALQTNLEAAHVDWPAVMMAVNGADGAQITLDGLSQTDNRVLISGRAVDEGAVLAYAQQLTDSEQFARVIVQSISVISASTSPAPRQTPTPPGATTLSAPPTVEYVILVEVRAQP